MELSVIVPVYNAEKTLSETLQSLLNQDCGPVFEIIAVDDGSTDNSVAILALYREKAERAGISFYILAQENSGPGAARNRGLRSAVGKAILFLDADDLLEPFALRQALEKKKATRARMLIFDSVALSPDGAREAFFSSEASGGYLSCREAYLAQPCPWNRMIDRALWQESGLWFEEGILYEDLAVIPALASFCHEGDIYYDKKPLHRYYQAPDSIMRSAYSEKKRDIFASLDALRRNTRGMETETEYLAFLHLLRYFCWIFWNAGDRKALLTASEWMQKNYPHWRQNPLVRERHSRAERLGAWLFYRGHFGWIRLWKGTRV